MAKFNTFYPFTASDYTFTARTIQTSGATSGFSYVFICPADFANGALFDINIAVSSNGNSGSQNVAARIYALTTGGNWDSATPLSSQSNLANSTANFPANGVAEMSLTLTSALTKGTRYALRIFPNTTFTAGLGVNAVFATNNAYTGNVDEYHINGTTISTGTPNLAISNGTTWLTNRCTRRAIQTTPATTNATSQVGFRFTLPTGFNYTLNEVVLKGLQLDIGGATAGSYIGRLLDSTGATTVASSQSRTHGSGRTTTDTFSNFTFSFTTNPTLTGGTSYIFVVESALEKSMQFYEVQSNTDSSQTFNGEVTGLEVIRRNATSGAFTSSNTLGPPSYQSMPMAQIDATVNTGGTTSGMLVHTGMTGGIRG
jgi:hypothetical protein